ncbi:AraC family transcriptional regulator [Flavitalea sp. BT771]|uniref:helix-turn-helix domain-containing protein n=1 Tax=Flavitalea sp. BT771 TaxID=3063329 RepID=UPI0026E3A0F8|nr:AraC family transcriptional regulator [Flavitalea sp. BT771]MDO6430082.1 AraC family transcriptional regulator [Flavitalea sp. BT771]MDV6219779.1 AraC family transcriptional regulator [Flavitalea sp. BT771]
MRYEFRAYTPCIALEPYVNCYLHMKGSRCAHWQQQLVPGNIQGLGFIFGGSIQSSLVPDASTIRSFVLGQLQKPVAVHFKEDLDLITVLFKATGMYRLFGIPMQLFADRSIDFELLCSQQDEVAVRNVFCSDTTEKRIAAIEALLLEKLPQHPVQYADRIEYASRLMLSQGGNLTVNQLAREVNMSKRNLERHFIGQVGLSPKSFSCIARIKNVLELIIHQPISAWKDIAQKLEYADQAHFFHEFKKFTGKTPGEYFRSITVFDHFLYAG